MYSFHFRADIQCSAVIVGSGYHPHSTFGYVPESDELQLFCEKTSGQLFFSNEVEQMAKAPSSAKFSHSGVGSFSSLFLFSSSFDSLP